MNQSWKQIFQQYEKSLQDFKIEYIYKDFYKNSHFKCYPQESDLFKAFSFSEINQVKVVILGQDPYHGINQATGLAFGCNSLPIPPSLNNIKKLLLKDLNIELKDNSLEHWAKQGILLLNCSLTVFEKQPGCHLKYWKNFIDYIISELNKQENIIFIAWGAFAYKKLENINLDKHIILTSSHPSPLSCNKKFKEFPTFMESNVFSRINQYLDSQNQSIINW